jgi:hypothetical protein
MSATPPKSSVADAAQDRIRLFWRQIIVHLDDAGVTALLQFRQILRAAVERDAWRSASEHICYFSPDRQCCGTACLGFKSGPEGRGEWLT